MARLKSSLINIRVFHNWVKNRLLKESVDYLRDNYKIEDIKLLDLAVGRGGDIYKWYNLGIHKVVGIDIDEESIKGRDGAIQRFNMLKSKIGSNKTPDYKFFIYDLSNKDGMKHIDYSIKKTGFGRFNIVSCQFAIHYFFKDATSLDTLISMVARHIADNGFFIGTTMDGAEVMKMFMYGDMIDKDTYYLENKKDMVYSDTPYGNKFIVSLKSGPEDKHYFSDKKSEEYMVSIEELKSICANYGLMFIGTSSFKSWYEIYTKEKSTKYMLTDEQKEFSFLNFSFVFMKK